MSQYPGLRRWLAGAVLAASPFFVSVAEVAHAQGSTNVPPNPAKTVVMDLAVLDTLHTLGVDVAGVPSATNGRIIWRSTRTNATLRSGRCPNRTTRRSTAWGRT